MPLNKETKYYCDILKEPLSLMIETKYLSTSFLFHLFKKSIEFNKRKTLLTLAKSMELTYSKDFHNRRRLIWNYIFYHILFRIVFWNEFDYLFHCFVGGHISLQLCTLNRLLRFTRTVCRPICISRFLLVFVLGMQMTRLFHNFFLDVPVVIVVGNGHGDSSSNPGRD